MQSGAFFVSIFQFKNFGDYSSKIKKKNKSHVSSSDCLIDFHSLVSANVPKNKIKFGTKSLVTDLQKFKFQLGNYTGETEVIHNSNVYIFYLFIYV